MPTNRTGLDSAESTHTIQFASKRVSLFVIHRDPLCGRSDPLERCNVCITTLTESLLERAFEAHFGCFAPSRLPLSRERTSPSAEDRAARRPSFEGSAQDQVRGREPTRHA